MDLWNVHSFMKNKINKQTNKQTSPTHTKKKKKEKEKRKNTWHLNFDSCQYQSDLSDLVKKFVKSSYYSESGIYDGN